MITTGGTIAEAVRAVKAQGARDGIVVVATHGVLIPGAREQMRAVGVTEVIVSDSIAAGPDGELHVTRVGTAPLLADVVRRVVTAGSLRDLY
jgi:ribose-phosphate pyrophosphokinase